MLSKHEHISESKNIRDILNHCSFNTMLLLDLDNTVMESIQELGSDQWFVNLMDYACRISADKLEAVSLVIAIYHAVQHHTKTKAVEFEIVKIIKALQDIGVPVLAVSARGPQITGPTLEQLNAIGIKFSRQWGEGSFALPVDDKEHVPIYNQGIIFCNGNDKGKCLKAFFDKTNFYPAHVVMADDKGKHLHVVQSIIKSFGGQFVGLRYGHLDEKVAGFNMAKANVQLSQIYHLLPLDVQQAIDKLKIKSVSPTRAAFFSGSVMSEPSTVVLEEKVETRLKIS